MSRAKLAEYIARNDQSSEVLAQSVAALLIDTNKTSELDSLMRDVSEVRASRHGVVELTATSAFPLSESSLKQITGLVKNHFLTAKKVVINNEIDKSVIGGVNLKFANASLDMTVRSKLNKLREATA